MVLQYSGLGWVSLSAAVEEEVKGSWSLLAVVRFPSYTSRSATQKTTQVAARCRQTQNPPQSPVRVKSPSSHCEGYPSSDICLSQGNGYFRHCSSVNRQFSELLSPCCLPLLKCCIQCSKMKEWAWICFWKTIPAFWDFATFLFKIQRCRLVNPSSFILPLGVALIW